MKARLLRLAGVMILSAVAIGAAPAIANASYPNKPVTLIVGFPPGGSSDFFTRTVANELTKMWGKPVIVENRPGAGGNIGAQAAARAPGDGYTLYMSSISTHGINPAFYKNPGYDAMKDFVMISKIAEVPNVVIVNPSLPVKTIAEFLDWAKANPSKAFYASSGAGTGPHLCIELIKSMTKAQLSHVAYKGSGPALMDVMAGTVPMACDNLPSSMPNIKAGKVRALAVTSKTRSPELPEVPTVAESGIPGYEMTSWWALVGTRGTPPDVVKKIHDDVARLLASPQIKEAFAKQGALSTPSTPEELTRLVNSEMARWTKVVREAGITAD